MTKLAVVVALVGGCVGDEVGGPSTPLPTTTVTVPASTEPTPTSAPTPDDPCAALADPIPTGRLADPSLDEVSGAAVSAWDPEVVWLLEDSGNPPVLTAVSARGATVATVGVGAPNVDWEDLALAPGPGGRPHLFVADVGDNAAARSSVAVVRLPEPDPAAPPGAVDAERLELVLPGGPADAEALLVDPVRGDLVVVTKDASGTARVLVATGAATAPADGPLELVDAGVLDLGPLEAILAGDASRDAGVVALRSPFTLLLWPWPTDVALVDALLGTTPCRAGAVTDPFGEALALHPDGGLLLTGEGAGATLWRLDR